MTHSLSRHELIRTGDLGDPPNKDFQAPFNLEVDESHPQNEISSHPDVDALPTTI